MIRKYLYGGPGYFLGGVTAKDLDEGTKKVAKGFNWLMGKVGDTFNTVVTAGASSDFGQTSPFALMDRKAVAKSREQFRQKAKKAIEENAVYVSPSSHVAAWTQGSWNPKVGALFLASDPRLQALGAVGDLAALKYTPKAAKVGKNLSLILKKRSVISKVNKELKKGIKENSVLESYNEVPANKDIGTVYDYLDFLDNIYPNSKLNATFYHGGPKGITRFKTAKELGSTNKGINSATKDYGIYLADDKSLALYYAGTNKKANRHLYNVRVNVQNPMRYETNNWYMDKMSTTGDLRFRPGEITLKWYDKLGLKDYDGIYHTKSKNAFDNGELVMLDGDNIHIMGTPKESLMFRNWKLNPLYSSKPLLEEIPLTPEQYERSFLNYAKASKPGLFFAGLVATPPALIWYDNYLKSKVANARKWKHLLGGIMNYLTWSNMSVGDLWKYRLNRAKAHLLHPTIGNVWEAGKTILGGNDPENPNLNLMTAPDILPGKVNMSLYKDAKNILKGALTNEGFVSFVDRLAKGKINPRFITKNGTLSPANYNYVDLKSESIPKGFVGGSEISFNNVRQPLEGLTVRTAKPFKLENPINTEAEALAARDYLNMIKEKNPVQQIIKKGRPKGSKNKPKETPQLTPVVVNKKIGNAKVNQHERYIDRRDYSKSSRQRDKYARGMESEKASPVNSGNYSMPRKQIEEMKREMDFNPHFRKIKEGYIKREANIPYSKNPEQAKIQLKKDWNKTLEEFKEFKKHGFFGKKAKGGLIWFAEEGAKTSWWKKAGNWAKDNSGTLLNIGSSLLSTFGNSSSNPSSNNTEILEASLEMLKALDKNNNTLKAYEMALKILNNSLDPNNPNAKGGVFALVLPFKLKSMLDLLVDSNYNNQKALLAMQNQSLDNSGGGLSNWLGIGENLISLIGNKKTSTDDTSTGTGLDSNSLYGSRNKNFFSNPSLGRIDGAIPSMNFGVKTSYGTF